MVWSGFSLGSITIVMEWHVFASGGGDWNHEWIWDYEEIGEAEFNFIWRCKLELDHEVEYIFSDMFLFIKWNYMFLHLEGWLTMSEYETMGK